MNSYFKLKESETLELKKSTAQLKPAVISIVAMLNKHQEGKLYFGVKDDGTIVGQEIGNDTLRAISQAISAHIEPRIYPAIKQVTLQGKTCIELEFRGNEVPYFAYGKAYIRTSDEDMPLSVKELENLILRKNKDQLKWDRSICKEAVLGDIDEQKVRFFLKEAGREFSGLENSLKKLKLIDAGKLTNAAVILFGKKPEDFFPNARLRCAVFATNDTSYIIDMQDYTGDLFYLIGEAEKYILRNIHIGMRLEGLKRIDVPEIAKEAIREAIINAFCHRDYYEYDSVNVAIFKNRVEIRNKGLLYGGLTIEQIKTEMVSERRNELIAEIFHEIHWIEKWGRGISLILSMEQDADFKEIGTQFIVTFKRKYFEESEEKVEEKKVEGWSERWSERWSEINESQRKILILVQNNPAIAKTELADKLGINPSAVQKNLNTLKKKGFLKRVGPARGGHWQIIEE
ncbi:winged helix-turn-helix transcriptional regulator [Methanosarcina sp. KYL-1]|uniref:RNA-binding domain-containing protein n=1 Tax=Methanosarcina sp. KYL-1 TaxID=2602068 RepID=UPI002101863F|nr:RNA-binding domain-containing protein [Methanosarcina sp. KYL-1]MCQ1535567.1 winged helix-turn-helix transcriptional regulator [Methanosarcina sp. KYL-1]